MSDKVESFLDSVKLFVDGMIARELQDFCTPDFVQKSVTSIFISENQVPYGSRNTVPATTEGSTASAGDKKEVKGVLQKKKQDDRNGKKQYSVQIGGSWYNTLSADAFGGRKFSEGEEVVAEVKAKEVNGKIYWNLLKLTAVNADVDGDEIPF